MSFDEDFQESAEKDATAEWLTQLTDGQVTIEYTPDATFEDDSTSTGHLFLGALSEHDEQVSVLLDDRAPEPLEAQLLAELRRLAGLYGELAAKVEARIREGH